LRRSGGLFLFAAAELAVFVFVHIAAPALLWLLAIWLVLIFAPGVVTLLAPAAGLALVLLALAGVSTLLLALPGLAALLVLVVAIHLIAHGRSLRWPH